jgi:membrane associated rhomboid family serine protease
VDSEPQPKPAPPGTDRLTEEEKADLVCLGIYPSSQTAHQAGTVLLTQNHWYAIFPSKNQWGLYVRSAIAEEASQLVQKNLNETAGAPLSPPDCETPPSKTVAPWHLIPVPLSFMIIHGLSTTEKGKYLTESGRFDSLRILENGEWWRLASALFLHADISHLLGNVFGILIFGGLLASRIGTATTYLIALLSGIAGNGLNLLTFRNTPHLSIGASTAVFGLLGALTGLRFRELLTHESGTLQTCAPVIRKRARFIRYGALGIGLVLLSWMGSGGERTDISAHLYGFVSGFLLLFLSLDPSQKFRRKK